MNNIQPTTGLSHLVHANLNKQSNSPKKKIAQNHWACMKRNLQKISRKIGFLMTILHNLDFSIFWKFTKITKLRVIMQRSPELLITDKNSISISPIGWRTNGWSWMVTYTMVRQRAIPSPTPKPHLNALRFKFEVIF